MSENSINAIAILEGIMHHNRLRKNSTFFASQDFWAALALERKFILSIGNSSSVWSNISVRNYEHKAGFLKNEPLLSNVF